MQVVEKMVSPTQKEPYVVVHIQVLKERAKHGTKGQGQQQQQPNAQGHKPPQTLGRSVSSSSSSFQVGGLGCLSGL